MQVVLGNRGDYTVRAVLYLARHPGRQRRQAIAESMAIPAKYLPQILGPLVRAGIVRSTVGRSGGYEIARPARSISLREVIEVADGPITSSKCVLRGGPCYWESKCALHDAWLAAEAALSRQLEMTTFADIARLDRAMERERNLRPSKGGTGRPPPPRGTDAIP
jgi:Rrf2 family protein